MTYLLRLIALPFVMILYMIGLVKGFFYAGYLFMKYGGEFIQFTKKANKDSLTTELRKLVAAGKEEEK